MAARPNDPWDSEWEVVRPLEPGGQGKTYLVQSRNMAGTSGVLKVLKNTGSSQARRRMQQEVVNLDLIANAGGRVPRVLASNTEAYADVKVPLYFVMEYFEGTHLAEMIAKGGNLSIDNAIDLVLDIADTVAVGHGERVLHRDLKPENIVIRQHVTGAREVFVVDFGLSFNNDGPTDVTNADEAFRNKFLTLPETYMAGEDHRDARSDLTAISGLLLFCLTGRSPQMLLDSQGRQPHQRPDALLKEILPGDNRIHHLNSFFSLAFRHDVSERFQTMHELIGRLSGLRDMKGQVVFGDPASFAIEASKEFLRRDRTAQLAEMLKVVQPVIGGMVAAWRNVLPPNTQFQLAQAHVQKTELPIVQGTKHLADSMILTINHEAHPGRKRGVVFRFMADGLETVILACKLCGEAARRQLPPGMAGAGLGLGGGFGQFVHSLPQQMPLGPMKFTAQATWSEVFRFPGLGPCVNEPINEYLNRFVHEAIESILTEANGAEA